jgi:pimeloyl-ACP methyl ester carboxylesterase
MPHFENAGLSLYYEVHGSGSPVVMLHGAAVSFAGNYGACGWIDPMTSRGLQVIGLDARGHGGSDAPPDPSASGTEPLSRDVVALLDHLDIDRAAVVGYSIGSTIALHLLHTHPERLRAGALVATGDGMIGIPPLTFPAILPILVENLQRPEFPTDVPAHQAMYWTFATQVAGNREGVAMMARGEFQPCTRQEAASIDVPVLVISGENDPVLGTGARLAEALPKGRYVEIPGADHFSLAIDETVQKEVAGFLA